jgi:hypothetical protein
VIFVAEHPAKHRRRTRPPSPSATLKEFFASSWDGQRDVHPAPFDLTFVNRLMNAFTFIYAPIRNRRTNRVAGRTGRNPRAARATMAVFSFRLEKLAGDGNLFMSMSPFPPRRPVAAGRRILFQ